MAEELVFHEVFGNGAAVYGNEGLVASRAELVDEPCQKTFSRARFSGDDDVGIAPGGGDDILHELLYGGTFPEEDVVMLSDLLKKRTYSCLQLLLLRKYGLLPQHVVRVVGERAEKYGAVAPGKHAGVTYDVPEFSFRGAVAPAVGVAAYNLLMVVAVESVEAGLVALVDEIVSGLPAYLGLIVAVHKVHVGPVHEIEPVILHECHGQRKAVDDEPDQGRVLHGLLESCGCEKLNDAVRAGFFIDGQTAPGPERAGKGPFHGNDARPVRRVVGGA